jgi:predicted component of type VI protein secretion system
LPCASQRVTLHRLVDDAAELHDLATKLDLSARNPAHVEQVVHQPHHLADLAVEHS